LGVSDDRPPRPEGVEAPCEVEVIDAASLGLDASARLSESVRRAMLELGASGSVRVRAVRDAEMADAHQRWLDAPGTTDVITSDLSEGRSASNRVLDADLLVCVDEARRQAHSRGHGFEAELTLYAVHGMLHCLGHDDQSEAQAERMHRVEDEVLGAIGVGAAYAASPHASPGDGKDRR